ncbi:hypothetical protein JAAARDRAFT_199145 [Jaapia argillacea MUCL 33604]|uniref:Uncharacterized protein n=1 Tax=Jaapia argillacea MUCL 33604 TaxID=933084 RepID=A0A067PLG9_9AGAM|nr:hypothetical protein JAAARDRAFT_199145 [Jaapia argillacea MUCL 33604]
MAKHARKRQKTSKNSESNPLGSKSFNNNLLDDSEKDDEERRLESMLFGTKYVPPDGSKKNGGHVVVIEDEDEDGVEDGGGRVFQNLLDTDLFFVDDGAPSVPSPLDAPAFDADIGLDEVESDEASGSQASDRDSDDEHSQESDDESVNSENPPQDPSSSHPPLKITSNKHKPPAWQDPDDTALQVSLFSSRLRKLRDAPDEDSVGGREYERRLRRQYEKINPTPEWALNARRKDKGKRRRESGSGREDGDEDEERDVMDDLMNSTGGILSDGVKRKAKVIAQGALDIERLRDANLSAKAEGEIKAVQFHPSPRIPVLLAASSDRRLRLFHVDGHSNPHLQTLHIPSLPITTASFHPTGSSIFLAGPRPFYYTHDLQSGTTRRSPRGLWGTTFNSTNEATSTSMEISSFSPTGEVLAVAGRRGYVYFVDWKSSAGQVVGSVKMNVGVKSLWWGQGRSGLSGQGRELLTLGEDSEVYVWDVGERKCVRKWKDDGGFGSRVMGGDKRGSYLAIGSTTGFVNVYGFEATASSTSSLKPPKSLKTIGNLTTSISSLCFNHDSQLLAIASNTKKDQMRMIHLPSLTSFSNWPTASTPLGHVTAMDFAAGSEYVALGNSRGRVLLYHLKDFAP